MQDLFEHRLGLGVATRLYGILNILWGRECLSLSPRGYHQCGANQ
jgi:hypothetical protein